MTMARRMGLVFAAVLLASARAVDFGAPVVPEPPQAEALASPDRIKATMEPKGGTAEAKAQMVAVAAKAAARWQPPSWLRRRLPRRRQRR